VKKGAEPELSNILAMHKALEKDGYHPIIIVDAALHHVVDQPEQLGDLIDEDRIWQAPAGTDADYFILETAERLHAQVVSNDEYRSLSRPVPLIDELRVRYMVINGHVKIYQPAIRSDSLQEEQEA
jgi:hypothetical protein